MQEKINKILQTINECKDPIKDFEAREKRDAILLDIGMELLDLPREKVEGYARNEDESSALHWFYTRFIYAKNKNRPIKKEN